MFISRRILIASSSSITLSIPITRIAAATTSSVFNTNTVASPAFSTYSRPTIVAGNRQSLTTTTTERNRIGNRRTMASATSIYDFTATKQLGGQLPLSELKGKVVLIVNVASKCGFTPQYEGLEALHEKYADRGLVVLGFPCNQFGGQEPGTDADIKQFCQTNYGIKFPMMSKVDVNGDNADPLWEHLKSQRPGLLGLKRVKWNYEKFLVGRDGKVVERWASLTKPESLAPAIERELEKKVDVASL